MTANDPSGATIQLELSGTLLCETKSAECAPGCLRRAVCEQGLEVMSARIINLAEARASRAKARMIRIDETSSQTDNDAALMQRFQFWTGASGRRYVHTIYTLLDCPALSAGNYMLVRRDEAGQRAIMEIGYLSATSPSLNLADVRQRGATLGANEVHIHLLAESPREALRIEFDLKCGNFDDMAAHASATQH